MILAADLWLIFKKYNNFRDVYACKYKKDGTEVAMKIMYLEEQEV